MIINLIRNELKKEFKKKYILVFIILLIFISGITVYFNNQKDIEGNIRYIEKIEEKDYNKYNFYSNYKQYINQYNIYNKKLSEDVKINEYLIKNDINNNQKEKMILENSFIISLFVVLIISIIGGTIVSQEYNKGSIKVLLSKPVKRWKILLSKVITINLINFILLFTILVSMTLFVILIYKINIFNLNEIIIIHNKINQVNYYIKFLKEFFINSLPVFFVGNFALMLSTLTLNTSLAVGLSVFISIAGGIISQFLFALRLKFIEYTFLPYLDFNIFKDYVDIINNNIIYGINLNIIKGSIILLIFFIFFYILSNLSFSKKDIKN